jgi:hypothetical protein
MIEQLFGSKTRANLLRTFFRQPEKSFFVRELSRVLEVQLNAVRRELELLVKLGLVKEMIKKEGVRSSEPGVGLRKYYALNPASTIYFELQALMTKGQVADEKELVKEIIDNGGEFSLFILTGRFTADKKAPVDMLLVGNLKERTVARLIAEYEKKTGFPIRFTTLTDGEFAERRQMMDKFLYSIFESECTKVVNKLNV